VKGGNSASTSIEILLDGFLEERECFAGFAALHHLESFTQVPVAPLRDRFDEARIFRIVSQGGADLPDAGVDSRIVVDEGVVGPKLPLNLLAADLVLDGQNYIWSFLAEPLEVEVLDVLPERHLLRLLVVVVQPAELLRVHPQLASHLDLGVRQVAAPTRVYPSLHLLVRLLFLLGHSAYLKRSKPSGGFVVEHDCRDKNSEIDQ
jgi:hypothetical protein